MPCRLQAALNAVTMRSRSEGVASIGTRSLSCRFTPHAPTSASSLTASTGGSGGRTSEPNGSRPRLATVQRPNENLCSGRGTYESALISYDLIGMAGLKSGPTYDSMSVAYVGRDVSRANPAFYQRTDFNAG